MTTFPMPAWVAETSRLTPTEKALLCLLVRRAQPDGRSWPGIRRLADDIGRSDRTVQRSLRRLERLGLLSIQSRAGIRQHNVYTLHLAGGDIHVTTPRAAETTTIPRAVVLTHLLHSRGAAKPTISVAFAVPGPVRQAAVAAGVSVGVALAARYELCRALGHGPENGDAALLAWLHVMDRGRRAALRFERIRRPAAWLRARRETSPPDWAYDWAKRELRAAARWEEARACHTA